MNKYLVEFIGTFFLVLTIFAAVAKAGAMAPVAIGLALMVMVYAGGHISGAHYNPAVSLGLAIRGALSWGQLVPYIIAQVAGAAVAALLAKGVFGFGGEGVQENFEVMPSLIAEILGTFALVYVVINVATAKANEGNSYFGLAIGLTVTAMAYGLGAISGGAFNPAVAVGTSVGGLFAWSNIWVYMAGCFAGGALAAIVFRIVSPGDHE